MYNPHETIEENFERVERELCAARAALRRMNSDILERHSGTTNHREWANHASVWLHPGDWIAMHTAEDTAAIEAAKRLIP